MNGLQICWLTPDVDAPLMTPRSALYCELGSSMLIGRKDGEKFNREWRREGEGILVGRCSR